jgi:serine/threonine protein kinase
VTNSDRPAVGDLIGGRFRIERVLGEGGYGSVVSALDEANSVRVALKLVARASHARDRRRWTAECDTMRAIAHPNVTRFIESGDHGLALSYVAMELVDGPSLAAVLGEGIALEVGTAIAIACEMLAGLVAMHACRIVHRDVKPANVVLTQADGFTRVVLVDFGLAHLSKVDVSWSRPTRTGTVVGTASYLAPERIEGALGDARADIWSVGVILFEMLVGRPPFRSKTATRTMLQVLSSQLPELPDTLPLRDTLRPVLFTALEKASDRRFASASAFRDALLAVPIERCISLDASVWHPAPIAPPTETSARPIPGRRSR